MGSTSSVFDADIKHEDQEQYGNDGKGRLIRFQRAFIMSNTFSIQSLLPTAAMVTAMI